MGNGWFNLVLTLCAVRGFWQDYRGYEKAKLSWKGLAEGLIFIIFFFAVCYRDEGGDVYVAELGFVTQGEPVVGEVL